MKILFQFIKKFYFNNLKIQQLTFIFSKLINNEISKNFLKENGAKIFFDLLKFNINNLLIKSNILSTMCKLSNNDTFLKSIGEEKIKIIIELIQSSEEKQIVILCLNLIWNISYIDDNDFKIYYSRGIEIIISTIKKFGDVRKIVYNGLGALGNIILSFTNKIIANNNELIPIVLNLTNKHANDEKIIEKATYMIFCMTSYKEFRKKFYSLNGIELIFKIMKKYESNDKIIIVIFQLFWNLSYDADCIKKIFDFDFLLFMNLHKDNFRISIVGIVLLANLIQDDDVLKIVKEKKILKDVVGNIKKFITIKVEDKLDFTLEEIDCDFFSKYLKKFENDVEVYELLCCLFFFLEKFKKFENFRKEDVEIFIKNEKKNKNLEIQNLLIDLLKKNNRIKI
jgi:hypothetical protein